MYNDTKDKIANVRTNPKYSLPLVLGTVLRHHSVILDYDWVISIAQS
jgi:hypothetical protein